MQKAIRFKRSPLAQATIAALAMALAVPALAQNQTTNNQQDEDEEAKELEAVQVVGSRIKRAEIEGPAPVTVITREDFEREGFSTVADVLDTLTQNTTASFTGDLAVNGFTPNAQVVNLRALGPGYTLTLINGRRPAQYPQPYNRDNNVVNVRAIPTAMIERIEVLTGGASAIYGSDAVAGVVNIVLRNSYDGQSVRGQIGTTAEGGGDSFVAEYVGGFTSDRWSTIFGAQYTHSEPVFARQRDILSDTRNGPLGPALTNPALALATLAFNPANGGIGRSVYYPGQDVCDRFGYTTVNTAARGQYCGGFTAPASRSISNKEDSYAARVYTTFDAGDNLELFGGISVYKQEAIASSGTEFWATSGNAFIRTQDDRQVNGYFDPQFNSFTFLQRILNPFELGGEEAASTKFDEQTYDVLLGARGTLADRFDWEASASYGRYDYEQDRPRLLAQGITDYFLGPVEGFQLASNGLRYQIRRLNLARWNQPITPEVYRSFSTRVINEGETTASQANFSLSGDLFELPGGNAGFASVLEYARQTVDLRSDARTNPLRPRDAQTVYNLVSSGRTVGDRDRVAIGGEIRLPVLSTLTANLAARYDKYDDITEVDDAVTYQAGLEFRPIEDLLLRASYATSFRAPDMQLVYAEGAASFSGIRDEYACRSGTGVAQGLGARTLAQCQAAVGDPTLYTTQTTIAGNPLLKEEEGTSLTAGFVWDIAEGLSLTADYYRIKLEDQSLQLTSGFLLQNEADCRLGVRRDGSPFPNAIDSAFCQNVLGLVSRQGGQANAAITRINSAYINSALLDTSGVDASVSYDFDTASAGSFDFELGWSIKLTDKSKQFASDPLVDTRDVPSIESRSRVRGSASWSYDDWTTTVFGTRFGTVSSFNGVDGTNAAGGFYPRRLKPYMLYNMTVSKRFGDDITATFTVVNVMNNQYRFDNGATGYPFFEYYLGADPLGRRYALSVQYRF
jgi:outer membrane receptor protein involved in Fe transport